jgi:myo-inositol 2-dehydrogenase/D-chiro-inositol 1-dehydrogenase
VGDTVRLVRVCTYLPAHEELVDLATDLVAPAPPRPPATGDLDERDRQVTRIRAGILGLATHDLPLVRALLPAVDQVTVARVVAPFGYQLSFTCGQRTAQLHALMPGTWEADWTTTAWGPEQELHVRFPPSHVLAGSATAELATRDRRTVWRYPHNGYRAEWLHLADVVQGRAAPAVPAQSAVDDLLYTLRLADADEKGIRESP